MMRSVDHSGGGVLSKQQLLQVIFNITALRVNHSATKNRRLPWFSRCGQSTTFWGGGAATFAGLWPDKLRGKTFCMIFPATRVVRSMDPDGVLSKQKLLQVKDSGLENSTDGSFIIEKGSTRAEDAQGTPTQSHVSPSILEYTKIICRFFFIHTPRVFFSVPCRMIRSSRCVGHPMGVLSPLSCPSRCAEFVVPGRGVFAEDTRVCAHTRDDRARTKC